MTECPATLNPVRLGEPNESDEPDEPDERAVTMPTIEELREQYRTMGDKFDSAPTATEVEEIDPSVILCFDNDYSGSGAEVTIDTDEFTAVCPWTVLPDYGTLVVRYVPDHLIIELKSLKYYLMQYRNVGVVQEHVANKILADLVAAANPVSMGIELDYKVRGGLHTAVTARFQRP
jgi:7-cyano-7-deazaguanine reductase